MAWIRYYIRLSHALVAVLALAYAGWADTRAAGIHGRRKSALSCCMEARVRRNTAATGE